MNEARPLSEWNEDVGDVLWWTFPVEEPPYVGTPNDLGHPIEVSVAFFDGGQRMTANVGGWPGYHTHWTPIPIPAKPDDDEKERAAVTTGERE